MTPRTFVLLGLAATVSVLTALVVHGNANTWAPGSVSGVKLAPSLASSAKDIATVTLSQGATTMTLDRGKDGVWTLRERGGYRADAEKVRALLVKLTQAELIEAKTRDASRHGLLELEDPAGKEAKSRAIRIVDGKGGVLADLIVGKQRIDAFGTGKDGTYVRKTGEAATWLASGEIDTPLDIRAWIKPGIVAIDGAKISRMTIEVPGEAPLEIKREGEKGDGKAAFAGIAEGKKLKDASAAEILLRAAATLDAEDVRKASEPPLGTEAGSISLATADGLALILKLRKTGAETWASIAAAGEGDSKAAADAIKAKADGFEIKLPSAKADSLLKRRADLIEGS